MLIDNTDRTMAGERPHAEPGTGILDTQLHTNAKRQTLCRHGSNVPTYEGSGTKPSHDRLSYIHERAHFDTFLRNTELPPGHVFSIVFFLKGLF